MTESNGNLPVWPGADYVYSKAGRILEAMNRRGHAKPGICVPTKKGWKTLHPGSVSEEMTRLIKALGKGDEEELKGLLLMDWIYYE